MAKRTNNDIQTITQKIQDCATLTPLKTESELMCSGRVSSSFTTRYRIFWLSLFVFTLSFNRPGDILDQLADPFTHMVAIGNSCFGWSMSLNNLLKSRLAKSTEIGRKHLWNILYKKSLKKPKVYAESVYRRRTYNTIAT